MRTSFFLLALSFSQVTYAADPCEAAKGWREAVCSFAKTNLQHSAWGFEHGKRDYLLASKLAQEDKRSVDDDVLFAAAMLHDMGAFAPYEIEGVDHAVRSAQVLETVLVPAGFEKSKLENVKKAVLTHSYYATEPPQTNEAIVLHDADTLDFLGHIGAARIFSVVGREKSFPDLLSAFKLLKHFEATLSSKIVGGEFSQELATTRTMQLTMTLKALEGASFGLRNL